MRACRGKAVGALLEGAGLASSYLAAMRMTLN
jgi:hypothetical protein